MGEKADLDETIQPPPPPPRMNVDDWSDPEPPRDRRDQRRSAVTGH